MQTVAIISQKGGAGKTTLALHLAVASAQAGRNTALIDLDPQASATKWADRREAELPVVRSAHASRLPNEMQWVETNGGEVLFLDTAPHADGVALAAARAADLVIVPCKPTILDVEATVTTLQLVQTTGTPVFVVLTAVPHFGPEAAEAESVIKDMTVAMCPARLSNRVAFSRSLTFGLVAQEFEPAGKAAREAERVHAFMCTHLQSCTPSDVHPPTVEIVHGQEAQQLCRGT